MLASKYRPTKLEQVIGQDAVVKSFTRALESKTLPHAILLSGPPGVGKTTLAKILASELGSTQMNIREKNMANTRGIDDIRAIIDNAGYKPFLGSGPSVFILDEFHQVTGAAAKSCLKILEDIPDHLYSFLCTSEPSKIDRALKTRLSAYNLNPLTPADLKVLAKNICAAEGKPELTPAEFNQLVSIAGGSARQFITSLEVLWLSGNDLSVLKGSLPEEDQELVQVVRAIIFGQDWATVHKGICAIPDEELDRFRWFILKYATSVAKDQKHAAIAVKAIICFGTPFFDSKHAGFLAAAWKCRVQ